MADTFYEKCVAHCRATYPCLTVETSEEARVNADIFRAARALSDGPAGRPVYLWSSVDGLRLLESRGGNGYRVTRTFDDPDTTDLEGCLREVHAGLIAGSRSLAAQSAADLPPFEPPTQGEAVIREALVVLYHPHRRLNDDARPELVRLAFEILTRAPAAGVTVIMVAPTFSLPSDLNTLVTPVDYPLPQEDDLRAIGKGIAASYALPDAQRAVTADVVRALKGLTTSQAENALALSCVERGAFDVDVLHREKQAAFKSSGLLEFIESDPRGLEAVGGLDKLKAWLQVRKRMLTPEAQAYGLPPSKGLLIVGVPGMGKSLTAKVIGSFFRRPTVKLDVGAFFGSLVGESESNVRAAIKYVDALGDVVLWLDELEKGFAGTSGSGANDSGTTKRVFGTFISWLQERKSSAFLIATANDVSALPPELLRKGRFDEIFALDLPNRREREEIWRIQISKYGRSPDAFDVPALVNVSDKFTGSEIEQAVIGGLYAAFAAGRELATADLLAEASAAVTLATTMREQIDGLREWARTRARPASTPDDERPQPKTTADDIAGGVRRFAGVREVK